MTQDSLKYFLLTFSLLFTLQIARAENDAEKKLSFPNKIKKNVTRPVKKAVTKTADATKEMAKEAHSVGGKLLQGIIDLMIAASPGKTRVYLPAPSSDPNSGITVGVLPVFLFVDKKEEIRHILAPSLTYNKIFKINPTMRYYWYPRPGAKLFTLASYAQETNRRFTIRYEDPKFFLDWFYFKFDYNFEREGSRRFFGFGGQSPLDQQSNYTLRDNHLKILTGINFLEFFRFTIGHRFRFANIVDGPIDSLPKISRFNPLPKGVNDPTNIFAQQAILSFDTRDLPVAPIRGHFFQISGEAAGPMGGDVRFQRVGADLRGFYPIKEARFVTAWRYKVESENGRDRVPLYERSLLGGKNSLRGFGTARFIDHNLMSIGIEERIRFYTLHAFNVNLDFEIAPFYETGAVYAERNQLQFSELHHVGGVGFRSVVRPNVVGVIDIGFSDQGTALFVGIDYPF